MRVIFIEGNIGAGKTSLLTSLGEHFGELVRVVEEPVKVWEESGLLAECYDGTVSRATFQHVALATKTAALVEALRETPPDQLIVAERSPFSDAAVFAKAFLDEEVEQRAYGVAHDASMRTIGPLECGFVFLEGASTATLGERICQRNRNGESSIDAGLLAQLETLHTELKQTLQASGRPVIGLDCSKDARKVFWAAADFIRPHVPGLLRFHR